MIEFITSAPYDVALLCVTAVYLFFAQRLFMEASRRDHGYAERIEHWRKLLQEAADQPEKPRPSPAE